MADSDDVRAAAALLIKHAPVQAYVELIARLRALSAALKEREAFYAKQAEADKATKACLDAIGWGCLTPRDNPETKETK